jgi:hypothetical protein
MRMHMHARQHDLQPAAQRVAMHRRHDRHAAIPNALAQFLQQRQPALHALPVLAGDIVQKQVQVEPCGEHAPLIAQHDADMRALGAL